MTTRIAVMAMLFASVLTGCAGSANWYSQRIDETAEEAKANGIKLTNLRLGQKRDAAVQVMGPPLRSEAFMTPDGKSIELLYYRTKGWEPHPWAAAYGDARIADKPDQFTVITIEDGAVIRWGRAQPEPATQMQAIPKR
jgi:hypothetical protein